jgi:hypothetical protein
MHPADPSLEMHHRGQGNAGEDEMGDLPVESTEVAVDETGNYRVEIGSVAHEVEDTHSI